MIKGQNKLILFISILFLFFVFANSTLAAELQSCQCQNLVNVEPQDSCVLCTSACQAIFHVGYKTCAPLANLPVTTITGTAAKTIANLSLDNPLCPAGTPNCLTPQLLIGRVVNSVLGVVGSIALIMFIFGGLTWMTSGGSADKIKKGRDIIVWSAIGLVIIFASYGLVRVLIQNVLNK